MIAAETKSAMLVGARESIRAKLENRVIPKIEQDDPVLDEYRGVFVTLRTRNHDLRGCIGYVEGIAPLRVAVLDIARASAFRDPRFPAVELPELASLVIEITVLTPLRIVDTIDEIEVGTHGLVVSKGARRGLLLPQVPLEHGWNREQFVSHTCMKAGLQPDTWKHEKLQYEVFEGEVFEENGAAG